MDNFFHFGLLCKHFDFYGGIFQCRKHCIKFGKDSVILILACAIYVGFSCTDDFTNRTVIYAITYGNRRLQILLAKYFCYIFGCTIIIISYMFVSMVISFLALGTEITLHSLFMYAVKSLLLSLPLFGVSATIFFFFAIITRKSTMAISISVTCSIIGVVFTNKAYFSMQQPNNSLLRFSPVIQIPMIYEQTLSAYDYMTTIIISMFIVVVVLLVGSVIFNKAEL